MEIVLHHKFTQNSDLKRELLTTGDAELIEVLSCWSKLIALTDDICL